MPLNYTTAPGWKQLPFDQQDNTYSIMRGKSGIVFTVASARDQPPEPRDSRHLLWTASRFASVWKLPLQQWSTPPQWRVYEADRKHSRRDTHIISGANDRYEFEAIAFIYDPETAADVYAALDVIFATTSDAAGNHIFGELTATKLAKKIVPSVSSGAEWVLGQQTIHVPVGWVPDDTVFPTPVSYSSGVVPPMFSLGRIEGPLASSCSLNLLWLPARELGQPAGRHRALGWKTRAEHWTSERGTTLMLNQTVTPLLRHSSALCKSRRTLRLANCSMSAGITGRNDWWYQRSEERRRSHPAICTRRR